MPPPGFVFNAPFTQVSFKNIDLAAATITFFVGNGKIDYKALVLSGLITVSDAQVIANTGAGGTLDTDLVSLNTNLSILTNLMQGKQGTQIIVDSGGVVTGTTLLYTVPANKTLYIQSAWININTQSATEVFASIQTQTAGAVLINNIIGVNANVASSSIPLASSYPSPLVVATGDLVKLFISTATPNCCGGFSGFIQ